MEMKRKIILKNAGVNSALTGCQLSQPQYQRRFRYGGNVSMFPVSDFPTIFPTTKPESFYKLFRYTLYLLYMIGT
jgi:hypothetical protein